MTRDLTSEVNTAAQGAVVRPVAMVRLDFAGGVVVVNSSPYTLTYAGEDYLGVGNLGRISGINEGMGNQSRGVSLTLSGIPSSMIAIALGEHYQGRSCKIYLGLLDVGHKLITDPVLLFGGDMDYMEIQSGQTASISLSAESRLADWDRPRVRRYTHEEQSARYPGDKGLEFVNATQGKEIRWGLA